MVSVTPLPLLVSFHYWRDVDMDAALGDYAGKARILADSGAYSATSIGATIDWREYVAWLRRWRHLIAEASNLDVIGNAEAGYDNLRRIEDAAPGVPIIPVYHTGAAWRWLER